MINNYFNHYGSKEQRIINEWVKTTPWLEKMVKKVEALNTGFHDAKITLTNGDSFLIELKEDELYWYGRTGNVGLDYLSAFNFSANKAKYTTLCRNWIKPADLEGFKDSIYVGKWGKLVTCDADVQLFYVKDKFTIAYNNCLLQDNLSYFEQNYSLRINNKGPYHIDDPWESASYFVKPRDFVLNGQTQRADKVLLDCEIKNLDDLTKAISMANVKYPNRK